MKPFISKPQKGDLIKVYLLTEKQEAEIQYMKVKTPINKQISYGIVQSVIEHTFMQHNKIITREIVLLKPTTIPAINVIPNYCFHKTKVMFI
jgi:hypothetical protein